MPDASRALPMFRAGCSPLIGRAGQLAVLVEHLAEARAGHPAVVLLAGAPGIGKTRLLETFPPPEVAAGVTVLRGGASQAEGMPPYLPFLEALGAYIAATPADLLRDQVGLGAGSLATLLPEIPARLGPPPPQYPLGPEQERFRLFEAVASFLAAIAARGPLILILDDLQWADTATCDLLVYVASRMRAAALLIVGAYRDDEAGENRAFVRALAELNRRRRLVTLPLQPLQPEESRALTTNLLRGEVAPEVADLLHRQGEGNPFFLEELLRVLVEERALVWQGGRWHLGRQPGRLVPPRVGEAIRIRLARLEPVVVELLRVAAVVGRVCEPALLARVVQMDVEQVEELLLVAARAHVVWPEADGAYAFTHDMVRETLYAEVGRARRRRLHQAIGEALEAQGEATSPHWLADLAFHFTEAGAQASGATYALAAGEQALRTSAAEEAMAYYRTAVRLLGPAGESARRASALTGLGDAAMLAGMYQEAVDAYHAAQESWLQSGDGVAAASAWYQLGRVRWRQEAVTEAREAFERALALLGPADGTEAAEALLQLADLHVTSLGRHVVGIAYAERALAMVERLGDKRLEATAYCVVGNVKARGNDLTAGQALLERALMLAQELDDPALAAEACAYLANVYAWTVDLDRSRAVSILRAELAQRTQDLFHLRHVYAWIGLQDVTQGRWTEAERWFAQQEPIVEGLQGPEPRASLRAYRGMLHYYQGRFEEAEQEYQAAVALVRPTGSGTRLWYLGQLGLVLAELGQHDEALACLAELHALTDALDEQAIARLGAFAYLAVGYARLGAHEHAAGCYPKLLPFQGQFAPIPVDRALGLAALAAGDRAAARLHLADAEAQARRAGMRPELALILIEHGLLERDLAGARSRSETADRLLAEGLRLCAELGMQELGRRALSPPLVRPDGRSKRGVRLAGLSARELEVLRLVAQGLTNREIAETLFLSENTVARHLTHIFTKTAVENRAGAVAFALRHGLA